MQLIWHHSRTTGGEERYIRTVAIVTTVYIRGQPVISELEVGHWPFCDQFYHLAEQSLLYISNGEPND